MLAVAHGTIEYLDETDTTINDGDSVTNGHQMALDDGPNTIKIKITSLDGNDTKTYTFVITRLRAPIALVSNTGQAGTTGPQERLSQSFTTGTNPEGYILNSIGLVTSMDPTNVVRVIVKLFSAKSDGTPGAELYALTNPDSYTARQIAPFSAPRGATLEPNTTYFVVTSGGDPTNFTPTVTASDDEDDGAAPGWSIADHALAIEGGAWVERTNAMQISINGQGRPDPTSAALLNLTITSQDAEIITLTPEFSPTTTDYGADVLYEINVVTVLPTTDNQAATVEYLGDSDLPIGDADVNAYGHQAILAVGVNTIKVKVTSQDGNHVQTYTVIVARRGEPVALVSNTSQSSAGGVLTQRSQNFTTGPRTKGIPTNQHRIAQHRSPGGYGKRHRKTLLNQPQRHPTYRALLPEQSEYLCRPTSGSLHRSKRSDPGSQHHLQRGCFQRNWQRRPGELRLWRHGKRQ